MNFNDGTYKKMLVGVNVAANLFGAFEQAAAGRRQARSYADAARSDFDAMSERAGQIARRGTQQIGQRATQAARELGRINAVMADSGLVGNSVQRLRQEVMLNRDQDIAILQRNSEDALTQAVREMRAIGNEYRSAISSIRRPSALGAGLRTAGMAIDIFGTKQPGSER